MWQIFSRMNKDNTHVFCLNSSSKISACKKHPKKTKQTHSLQFQSPWKTYAKSTLAFVRVSLLLCRSLKISHFIKQETGMWKKTHNCYCWHHSITEFNLAYQSCCGRSKTNSSFRPEPHTTTFGSQNQVLLNYASLEHCLATLLLYLALRCGQMRV